MATVNLNPDATLSNSWTIVNASTAHEALSDSSDASLIETHDQLDQCIVSLSNFDATALGVTSITSIRYMVSGFVQDTRTDTIDINVTLTSGNLATGVYYQETSTLTFNGYTPVDHYGTARTTSDGSSAWTDSDLDGLRLAIDTSIEDPPGGTSAKIVKAFVEVTYEAVAPATTYETGDNTIVIKKGIIELKNGITIIK